MARYATSTGLRRHPDADLMTYRVNVYDKDGRLIDIPIVFFDTETGEIDYLIEDDKGGFALDHTGTGVLIKSETFPPQFLPLTFKKIGD